jgi:hypothetical protein
VTKITLNHDLCPYVSTLPRVLKTQLIQALEMGGVMTRLIRGAGLVSIAVVLAGCGSNAAGSAEAAGSPGPASSSAAPQTAATVSPAGQPADVSRACQQPGKYLTAVRTARHAGYDRVVFQFSGGRPAVTAGSADSARSRPIRPGPARTG